MESFSDADLESLNAMIDQMVEIKVQEKMDIIFPKL